MPFMILMIVYLVSLHPLSPAAFLSATCTLHNPDVHLFGVLTPLCLTGNPTGTRTATLHAHKRFLPLGTFVSRCLPALHASAPLFFLACTCPQWHAREK